MYISNIKLWNFRKFGSDTFSIDTPSLDLNFNEGLNVLIGENDSGKTAIIDAIKLVLKTHSVEWIKVGYDDFFKNSNRFRIELILSKLSPIEAKNFTEWLGWTGTGDDAVPFLRLILDVKRNLSTTIISPSDVRAGVDTEGAQLSAEAREYLKVTYLKPLRDAETELIPKKNSRLSQILQGHEAFKGKGSTHSLVGDFRAFNETIKKYFEGIDNNNAEILDQNGKILKDQIDGYIKLFYDKDKESNFEVVEGNLKAILEKLELTIKDERNPGLGTLNRLFMSSELLHLNKVNWDGLRLGLIEELEGHLHPQAQMQVVETLQNQTSVQLILTTHSPNIGSKVNLKNIIICQGGKAFPLGETYTRLDGSDYLFLERFLDVTKSNLFFAKGIIFVEGWAEELLIPAIAKKIGVNLTEKGVSIVNVGSLAFLRYSKIFQRRNDPQMDVRISIVTDVDILPAEEELIEEGQPETLLVLKTRKLENKFNGGPIRSFVSPHWTLEYCFALCPGFNELYFNSIQKFRPQALGQLYADFIHGKNAEQIAFDLYDGHIKDKKNKAQIAQDFAFIIETNPAITKELLEAQPSITYIINAINYASRN